MTLRMRARRDAVTRALAGARLFCAGAEIADDTADRLAIVVEEWMLNVLEHGRPDPSSQIVLALAPGGGGVRLSFSDAGVAFDPRSVQFVAPNAERGGGAGIAMMLAWSSIETYRRARGRNLLVLAVAAR